jgi:hypothetical protein
MQGAFPAGHYYSPIPSRDDVLIHLSSKSKIENKLPEIDFKKNEQSRRLKVFESFYGDMPFREEKSANLRYYFSQIYFCYADAIFLYAFLRHTCPNRIIEVGSGFSSTVILDTVDRFFSSPPKITFVEPHADRLKNLIRPSDMVEHQILEMKVQDAPKSLFNSLQAGDLLFIDSSHVVKCGSDVQFLMFDVLPRLPKGTFVHFHDIFYPFEYPQEWLLSGRYWNEIYLLRAFLAYSSDWEIYFFNSYVAEVFKGVLSEKMPLCLKNPGGSIYIRRV